MNASRLELVDRDLMAQLQNTSPVQRLWIAQEICSLALHQTELIDSLLDKALLAIGKADESRSMLRPEVQALLDKLEDDYFGLLDSQESGQDSIKEVEIAFNKARAVNALYFALGENSVENLAEVIYEVQAAINDRAAVLQVVQEAQSNQNGA